MSPFLLLLLSMVNVPYRWGGKNPLIGLDCSGFTQWALRFTDLPSAGKVLNAQGIYGWLLQIGAKNVLYAPRKLGDIAFYGKNIEDITHVVVCVDSYRVIGACGGGSSTLTVADAERVGACVRGERLNYRNDLVAVLRPPYTLEL